jgi:hypothetical protein
LPKEQADNPEKTINKFLFPIILYGINNYFNDTITILRDRHFVICATKLVQIKNMAHYHAHQKRNSYIKYNRLKYHIAC